MKYYLRGLGIGIVVSTLLVGIATGNRKETLSDEEIKQRARELGMVETSGVIADELPITLATEAPTKEPVKEPVSAQENEKEVESSPAGEPEALPTEMPIAEEETAIAGEETEIAVEEAEMTGEEKVAEAGDETNNEETVSVATETPSETKEPSQTITITVKGGDGSYTVCKKLEEAGLIESATAYDAYLYRNGYDKRIIAASHEIPVGSDEEQIAKIITGKN